MKSHIRKKIESNVKARKEYVRKGTHGKHARASKRLKRPDIKQATLIRNLTDPESPTFGNQAASALAAGYAKKTHPESVLKGRNARKLLLDAMDKAGITEKRLAEKMSQGLESKSHWRHVNKVTGEVIEKHDDDANAQHKYLETALKIRGDFPQEDDAERSQLILRIPAAPISIQEWKKKYEVTAPQLLSEKDYIDVEPVPNPPGDVPPVPAHQGGTD